MSQTGAAGLALHGYGAEQILTHYYTGTTLGPIAARRTVAVLLQSGLRGAVFTGATRAGTRRLSPLAVYVASLATDGRIALESEHGRVLARLPSPLEIAGPAPLTLDGAASNGIVNGQYRGRLRLVAATSSLQVVNVVGIESYLRGVVPSESPSSWPAAELQAQAIAARSYAVASTPQTNFDLYSDTRSQQYDGVKAETATTDAAVAATRGQVVTYNGTPVITYYFASSGGETEDVQNAFMGAAAQPYLQGVADPFDTARFGPTTLTLHAAAAKLGGLLLGRLEGIVALRRGFSPRIVTADIVGSNGTTTVSGPTLAAALGLHTTWVCFTVTPPSGKPLAGWDTPCQQPLSPPAGPSGPSGPTSVTGLPAGGTLAPPSGATAPSGPTAPSGSTGTSGTTTGGAVAPGA